MSKESEAEYQERMQAEFQKKLQNKVLLSQDPELFGPLQFGTSTPTMTPTTSTNLSEVVFKWLVAVWLVVTIVQSVTLSTLGLWVVARMLIRLSI